jgi:hypothetical protein
VEQSALLILILALAVTRLVEMKIGLGAAPNPLPYLLIHLLPEAAVQLVFLVQATQRLVCRERGQVATVDKAVVLEQVTVTQSPSTAVGAVAISPLVIFRLGAEHPLFLA